MRQAAHLHLELHLPRLCILFRFVGAAVQNRRMMLVCSMQMASESLPRIIAL